MSERRRRSERSWPALWPLALIPIAVALTLAGLLILAANVVSFHPFESSGLPSPPSGSEFGTAREIGTRGDDPNPRVLYHGAYPSDSETQERRVGGVPARFGGYTTWVRSVARVPARTFVDAYSGSYLRVRVTVFNRDTEVQHVCACDFSVYTSARGRREADVVGAPTVSPYTTMPSGARRDGDVYLYVGNVSGPFFVVYDPDAHNTGDNRTATAVWRVPNI